LCDGVRHGVRGARETAGQLHIQLRIDFGQLAGQRDFLVEVEHKRVARRQKPSIQQ
jgi:hypothetical protein